MKYILMTDFGALPKGTIIDEQDRIEFTILTDKKFYDANPQQFSPLSELKQNSCPICRTLSSVCMCCGFGDGDE